MIHKAEAGQNLDSACFVSSDYFLVPHECQLVHYYYYCMVFGLF